MRCSVNPQPAGFGRTLQGEENVEIYVVAIHACAWKCVRAPECQEKETLLPRTCMVHTTHTRARGESSAGGSLPGRDAGESRRTRSQPDPAWEPHEERWRHLADWTAWVATQGCGPKALCGSSAPPFPGGQGPAGMTCRHAPKVPVLRGPPLFTRMSWAQGHSGSSSVTFPKRHWDGVSLGGLWEQ